MFENGRDHAPIVFAVRGAHEFLHLLLIGAPGRFVFFGQVAQRLLWNDWEDDHANSAIGLIKSGFGEPEE